MWKCWSKVEILNRTLRTSVCRSKLKKYLDKLDNI